MKYSCDTVTNADESELGKPCANNCKKAILNGKSRLIYLRIISGHRHETLASNMLIWSIFCLSHMHSKKRTTCSGLIKTGLKKVLLPTLFKVVNNTEQVDELELACNQV